MDSSAQLTDQIGASVTNGTFGSAPSDGEFGNPFLKYFGQPNGPIQYNARDARSSDRRDLPHAYIGHNNHIREIMEGTIFGNKTSWYTTLALPYLKNDNMNISWSVWTFDAHIVGQVPHEGVPRMITSSERGHTEKVTRRGLGFNLEHGFWNTARGHRQYLNNILQISESVQLTCNYDVLTALLNSNYHEQELQKRIQGGLVDMSALTTSEIQHFGICQKDPRGLELVVQLMRDRFNKMGITPNLFIVPPLMETYLSMVSEFHTSYASQGDQAVENFNKGPRTTGILRGMNTVTTDSFNVYENSPTEDLMARSVDTGAYSLMLHRLEYFKPGYSSEHRSIVIYDENTDSMTKITLKDALANCGRFDSKGYLSVQKHQHLIGRPLNTVSDIFITTDSTAKKQTRLASRFGDISPDHLPTNHIIETAKMIVAKKLQGAMGVKPSNTPTVTTPVVEGGEVNPSGAPADISQHRTWHESNKNALTAAGLAIQPYDSALLFTNDRAEFIEKFHNWVTENKSNLAKFSTAYTKLKKYNAASDRKKIADFNKVLTEINLLKSGESLNMSIDPVSDSLDLPEAVAAPVGTGSKWTKKHKSSSEHISDLLGSSRAALTGAGATPNTQVYGTSDNMTNHGTTISSRLANGDVKTTAIFIIQSLINIKFLNKLIDNDIPIPFDMILARPFISHRMYSMIMMKGGYDTGATFIGHTNMLLSDDGITKMHYGNYTFNSKAIVMRPKNIIVQPDVMFGGYRGGNGSQFFSANDIDKLKSRHPSVLRDRARPSILSMLIPINEKFYFHPIDITGWYKNDTKKEMKNLHYSSAQFYSKVYHFDGLSNRLNDMIGIKFGASSGKRNRIIAQDQWEFHVGNTNGHTGFRSSRSHLGPNLYAGVRAVFDGSLTQIKLLNRNETVI